MGSFIRLTTEDSPHLAKLFETFARKVSLDTGEVLFEEGDTGDAVFELKTGRLEVSVVSEDGRKLVLDFVSPGALVGEIALFDPGERTASLTALEPVELLRLSNSDVYREVRRSPELGLDLIKLAGRRMRWMNNQLGDQVFLPLPARLAGRILYLTTPDDGKLKLNQSQLAGFVGATREGVSNVLRGWKQDGLIELSRGGLTLLDRSAMETISESPEL